MIGLSVHHLFGMAISSFESISLLYEGNSVLYARYGIKQRCAAPDRGTVLLSLCNKIIYAIF